MLGNHDTQRPNQVDAGVGGIQGAGNRVEADLALDLALQLILKSGGIDCRFWRDRHLHKFQRTENSILHNGLVLTKQQLPTPALLLDLDKFEANLARMAARIKESGKSLRPHAKAHKCVEIAKRQIAAGAIGVCVATVAEAELMAAAGIPGLLLTSPVADPLKMARIVKTGAMVVVDHLQQVAWYDQAAGP